MVYTYISRRKEGERIGGYSHLPVGFRELKGL
jgi:hypothetical protein